MKDFTKNGKCVDCCRCCSNILLATERDIKVIKKYMRENNIVLKSPYSVLDSEYKEECPFLNKDKKCSIYPARLTICRSFSCNKDLHEEMEYKDTKVIDMLATFGKNLYYPCKPNLEELNREWEERVKRAYV